MSQRVGIYGGTFNPIHVGHLRAAEEAAERLGLERVVFVPSGQPPHKAGDPIACAEDRLSWVRDAIAGNLRFELSTIEIERSANLGLFFWARLVSQDRLDRITGDQSD